MRFSEYILRVENLIACFCRPISMLLCPKGMQIDDRMHRDNEAKRPSLPSILQGIELQSAGKECDTFLQYFEKSYASCGICSGF